jgi:hypothetical protein
LFAGANAMKFLQSVMAMLRGWTPGFLPLEMAVLNEAVRQLDPERGEKLQARINGINRVYRLDGGREVNTYTVTKGKVVIDKDARLAPEDGERKLAIFSFDASEYGKFKGAIWLVDGRFFSLEFNKPTEHILNDAPTDLQLILCV